MKKNPWRRGLIAVMAASALLVPIVASGPAAVAADDPTGTAVVKLVDAAGKPVTGQTQLMSVASGTSDQPPGALTAPGTYTFADLPVGGYGVFSMSPWGGLACAGISPCDYFMLAGAPGARTVTAAITVKDSATTVLTVRLPEPGAITGSAVVGKPLTLQWSTTMTNLLAVFGMAGAGASPVVQWLRNGAVIPGATGTSYTTTGQDAGRVVSARLSYPTPGMWALMGVDASPRLVAGRKITKSASRTTVDVFRKKVVRGRSPGVRIDVTAGDLPATGKVTIKIGKRTYTKTLRNGSARVPVPGTLKPGRYKVVATYLGSASYSASKGTGRFTVVRKG